MEGEEIERRLKEWREGQRNGGKAKGMPKEGRQDRVRGRESKIDGEG